MNDEAELLRRYAEEGAEVALAELVRRRVDLVYGAALRQVRGNAALAKDVTQAVFTELARKAGPLARHDVLVAWLHTAVRFAAAKALRAESRRRAREREAWIMSEVLGRDEPAAEWAWLGPVIDAALGDLKERERVAILLRFFEKRSLAEVGAALALSETAARSCVDRALDKLHGALTRRGITSTAAALGVALAGQASVAAPAGVAASATAAALAGVGQGAVAISGSVKVLWLMVSAAASVGVGVWVAQARARAELQQESARMRREGAEVVRWETENRKLAESLTEVDRLRRDDAELMRLRDEAAELKERLGRGLAAERAARPRASINGMIRMPGNYLFEPAGPMTLGELLAKAGGVTSTANPKKIRVSRNQPGGGARIYVKDIEGGDGAFILEPGDLVYVPERII